jgi:hypothetical protein
MDRGLGMPRCWKTDFDTGTPRPLTIWGLELAAENRRHERWELGRRNTGRRDGDWLDARLDR